MKTTTMIFLLAVLFLLVAAFLVAQVHAAPVPDYQCINPNGCYYMPWSRVVSEADRWQVAAPGTVLGVGDWRMLWSIRDWQEVTL